MDSLTTITEAVTGACGNGGPLMGDCSIITGAPDYSLFISENIWIMISAMLVFIMGLGFACVESGLCRAKSSANICFKNIAVPAIGISVYALVGLGLM